ncbi:MAG: leucine-rich repeat protein [Clostridia bacterium]|nr:leucine-rich repeat protein [Clostridia bacterium]
MKSIKITSIILFLAVVLLSIFIGGKQINSKIEQTIKENYQTEIDALKEKLNNQSALLNSIINIGNKPNNTTTNKQDTENTTTTTTTPKKNTTTNTPVEDEVLFEYIKENGGITITKYIGKQTNVTIPNKIEQLPVLKIGENAFADSKVKSVTLPSSCEEIDWFAFYGCFALTTIYISNEVNSIGYGAFDSCAKSLTIYCERNSYAQKYAQSFGIKYSIFQ